MIDTGGDGATILCAGREDRALAEEQPERSDRWDICEGFVGGDNRRLTAPTRGGTTPGRPEVTPSTGC